ncbi:unnamed protein product, partial [Adineta ricciae]
LPTANDPDEGLNSIQSYRLYGSNSDDFDVDYSAIEIPYLIVRSSLDRQRIATYSLTLIASDNGQQPGPRSGSIQLDIRIMNDSIPTFLQTVYTIDVREDVSIGTNLLRVEAISDENKPIFYELPTDSPFIIDRLTGNIQLKQFLDYERDKSYRLIVKAYETSIPVYAIVFIRVIDVNDNPVLIQINVQGNTTLEQIQTDRDIISIPEDTPVGNTLAHVILKDFDSIANGNPYLQLTTTQHPLPLIYKLIYQNSFHNLKFYSLILHTTLDRETKASYNDIQLLAHDSGTPTLHTRLSIFLNITDVNDCTPQITTNSTVYDVDENNPIGLIIDTLTAYDCDVGMNAEIGYRLLNTTDLLIVNSQTGQVSLNQSIHFDTFNQPKNRTSIDLVYYIQVFDHGQPSLSSERKLVLRVHDLNDHTPQFDPYQSYNWTFLKSNLQSNAVLGRVIARDDDSGLQGIIQYSIRSFDSCLTLDITSLGYVYILSQSSCSYLSYIFEITASDYGMPNPRSIKQLLTINIDPNPFLARSLPRLLPLSMLRTHVDSNSLGNVSFIIDITANQSIQPRIFLNNTDLSTCWNVSPTGEVRLIAQPYALSYILSLNTVDEYTGETFSSKLQIDICNSSIENSCQQLLTSESRKESQLLLFWAIGLALIITCVCVFIFSIITCLCCRKSRDEKDESINQRSFSQCTDDFHSEKTFKTSSESTMRDNDRDSACIINTKISTGIVPIRTNSWYQNRRESSDVPIYQTKTCLYDLKLAELIRHNQNPPCVFLNPKPAQSISTDHGFGGSDVSPSLTSCSSTKFDYPNVNPLEWSIEMGVDQSPPRQLNKSCFISAKECVV